MSAPPLNDEDVDAADRLAAAATAGPWTWWTSNSWRRLSSPRGDGDVLRPIVCTDEHPDLVCDDTDKAFIAAARELVPRLVATVRARSTRYCHLCGWSVVGGGIPHRANRVGCRDQDSCRRRADKSRRFWNGTDGCATFSVVADCAARAILFIAQHMVEMGLTDESSELSVEEVDREHARTVQIGGDEPCLFFDMEYGDVASSEY